MFSATRFLAIVFAFFAVGAVATGSKGSKGPKGTKSSLGPKGSKSPKSSKSSCEELCRELDDKCSCVSSPEPNRRFAPTDCSGLQDEICRDESGPKCDCGSICACRLQSRFLEGEYEPTDEEGFEMVKQAKGNLDAVVAYEHKLLSASECNLLMKHTDELISENSGATAVSEKDHVVKFLDSSPLEELIGTERAAALYRFFKDSTHNSPITQIWLRKNEGTPGKASYLKLHTDPSYSLKVYLNDDFEGGDIMSVDRNGVSTIPLVQGFGIAHSPDWVHGYRPHSGAKYILYIIGDTYAGAECMVDHPFSEHE